MNQQFPVIGLAASGIGLQDLFEFFKQLPARIPAAFVVVTHLPRAHESRLASLISLRARYRVLQLEQDTKVEMGRIYVMMPNTIVTATAAQLRVAKRLPDDRINTAIDQFFLSAAEAFGPRAVAVILGGMGSDGLVGCRAIEAAGGKVLSLQPADDRSREMATNVYERNSPDVVRATPVELAGQIVQLFAGHK